MASGLYAAWSEMLYPGPRDAAAARGSLEHGIPGFPK